MRALLDVNVIIALLDCDHALHERAHEWWGANLRSGWASCPLTENGAVCIMSNPAYSQHERFTPGNLILRLRQFAGQTNHEFWADDLSLRDNTVFAPERMHSSRQLTDVYLLALAAKRSGRLVTFDRAIPLSALRSIKPSNLCAL